MIPTRNTYEEYIRARRERTAQVIALRRPVTGRQVREQNLSVKQLCEAGYVLNTANDTLELKNG